MMNAKLLHDVVVDPVLRWLHGWAPLYDSPEARVLLLAIAGQETAYKTRLQKPVAHAKGWWQFEKNGGCAALERHAALAPFRVAMGELGFRTTREATWNAIGAGADDLACVMARGLLWPDPHPLPAVDDVNGAWEYYVRCWRPGKPHRSTWDRWHGEARAIVT